LRENGRRVGELKELESGKKREEKVKIKWSREPEQLSQK
jgi:hypothetical protein